MWMFVTGVWRWANTYEKPWLQHRWPTFGKNSFASLVLESVLIPLKILLYILPECVARVPVSLWEGMFAQRYATIRYPWRIRTAVHNRSQPFAWRPCGRASGKVFKSGLCLEVSVIAKLRFATQAWHLCHSNMCHDVSEVVFVRRAQYFCRSQIAFFVAGAALWRPPHSTLHTCTLNTPQSHFKKKTYLPSSTFHSLQCTGTLTGCWSDSPIEAMEDMLISQTSWWFWWAYHEP